MLYHNIARDCSFCYKLYPYALGGSKIQKNLVWISTKANPIPVANMSSHAKNQPSRCFGKACSWYPFYQGVASKGNTWKMSMWPYLGSKALNKKTKDTFISLTFKVWESKVSLLFLFVAQEPRYGLCIIFHVFPFDATLWKKGGLGGALPSHLGVWNFTWCLSSYRRMGKHTELNSNPTFVFFAPP